MGFKLIDEEVYPIGLVEGDLVWLTDKEGEPQRFLISKVAASIEENIVSIQTTVPYRRRLQLPGDEKVTRQVTVYDDDYDPFAGL